MSPLAFMMPFKVTVPRNRNTNWRIVRAITMSSDAENFHSHYIRDLRPDASLAHSLAMCISFSERRKNLFAGHLRRDFLSSRA